MNANDKGKIILVRMDKLDDALIEALTRGIGETFRRPVGVRSAVRDLSPVYDAGRRQYISPRLITRLRRIKKAPLDTVLGVVDVDMYSPGYDFIFGEAEVATGVATLSVYRLKPERYGEPPNPAVFAERAVKEAVHELGHLYGLGHCRNPECAMKFSESLPKVNAKGRAFCEKCQTHLEKALVVH